MKKLAWLLVRILISALLLGYLLGQADASAAVKARLLTIPQNWGWAALGLTCIGASLVLAGWRWWLTLRPLAEGVSFGFALKHVVIASFFNITSLGTLGGDAWRLLALQRTGNGCAATGGTSIIADHTAGMLGMLIYFSAVSSWALLHTESATDAMAGSLRMLALVLLGSSLVGLLLLTTLSPAFVRRFGRFTPGPLRGMVQELSQKFGLMLASWRTMVTATAVSVIMLSLYFYAFHCGLKAVGYNGAALPVMVAMPATDLAASLPISVSGIGVREKTFESLLHTLNATPPDQSVAGSLTGWAFTMAWGCLGGLLFAFAPAPTRTP